MCSAISFTECKVEKEDDSKIASLDLKDKRAWESRHARDSEIVLDYYWFETRHLGVWSSSECAAVAFKPRWQEYPNCMPLPNRWRCQKAVKRIFFQPFLLSIHHCSKSMQGKQSSGLADNGSTRSAEVTEVLEAVNDVMEQMRSWEDEKMTWWHVSN